MSHGSELENYRKAIRDLQTIEGIQQPSSWLYSSQQTTKEMLRGYLRAFMIDPQTKAILTTDQNFALAAKIVADLEKELDFGFVKPGQDWITALKQKAYFIGQKYQAQLVKGGAIADAVILQGVDATTLRILQQQTFSQVVDITDGQVGYIKRTLTSAILNNRTWDVTMDKVIHDGKIPALEIVDKNGVARYIEMETRVETLVRTETSRLGELGSKDKAREIYGDGELGGKWHTIIDGRERASHEARDGMIRTLKDWETVPGPDGKIISPGEESNCRCWMEWGNYNELAGLAPPRRATSTTTTKPPAKPPAAPPAKPPVTKPPVTKPPAAPKAPPTAPPAGAPAAKPMTNLPMNQWSQLPYKLDDNVYMKYAKKAKGAAPDTWPAESVEAFQTRMDRIFRTMTRYFEKHGIAVEHGAEISPPQMAKIAQAWRRLPRVATKRFEEVGSRMRIVPRFEIGRSEILQQRFIDLIEKQPLAVRKALKIPKNVKLTEANVRKYVQKKYDDTARGLHWARGDTVLDGSDMIIGADSAEVLTAPGLNTTSHEFGHFLDLNVGDMSRGFRFMQLIDEQPTVFMTDPYWGNQKMHLIKVALDITGREYGANHVRPQEVFAEMINCFLTSSSKNAELLDKWPEMWELCRRVSGLDPTWTGEVYNSELLFAQLKKGAEIYKAEKKVLTKPELEKLLAETKEAS